MAIDVNPGPGVSLLLTEKIVIHYRQPAKGASESLSPSTRGKARYLHDNRMRDSLADYLEDLEG